MSPVAVATILRCEPEQPRSGRAKGRADVTSVADIVGRAAVCDDRAWEDLVRRYSRLLAAIANQYRLGPGDRDDAVQMTWMDLVRSVHRLRDPERVGGWLATSMRRNCLRVLRHGGREVPTEDTLEWGTRGDHDAVDDRLLRAERDTLLWQSVEELPERQRDVVHALFVDELSYDDVSARMAMPVGAIGPTRLRALRRLEAVLTTRGVAA